MIMKCYHTQITATITATIIATKLAALLKDTPCGAGDGTEGTHSIVREHIL